MKQASKRSVQAASLRAQSMGSWRAMAIAFLMCFVKYRGPLSTFFVVVFSCVCVVKFSVTDYGNQYLNFDRFNYPYSKVCLCVLPMGITIF